jgi:hypothetical protein
MAWLSHQGVLLSTPNPAGWAGIICPNKDEHSDGNPEGRYSPSTRSYRCLHSHCVDFDSHAFLDWVAANGGPKHAPGLREELLAAVMDQTLSKLQPTPEFPDKGSEIIAEIEKKQLDRVEKESWYERFAYVQNEDAFFDMLDRREIDRRTFNALFRHVACYSLHKSKTPRRIEASICYDENRQAKGALTIAGITYAAGETVLVHAGVAPAILLGTPEQQAKDAAQNKGRPTPAGHAPPLTFREVRRAFFGFGIGVTNEAGRRFAMISRVG